MSNLKERFSHFWKSYGISIKTGSLVYAVTRLWLTLISVIVFFKVPILAPSVSGGSYTDVIPVLTGWRGALLGMWQRWDTVHYQSIAQWGYNQPLLTVFFPGYPVLSHAVSRLLHISDLAGLLVVSNFFAWLSLILLHRIVISMYDQHTANLALVFLVTFPSSFFLFAGYPQSMVLFLVVFSYWEAKHDHWLWAALAGLAAGLTHGTVVPLSIMLAWQAYQTLKKTRFSLRWVITIVPVFPLNGIALFLCWRYSRKFESYFLVQKYTWNMLTRMPWNTLILGLKRLLLNQDAVTLMNCLICLFLIFTVFWSIKKLPAELMIYSMAIAIFILSTGSSHNPLNSINRYFLLMFPSFICLAAITAKKKILHLIIVEINLLIQIFLCSLFFMWGWVG